MKLSVIQASPRGMRGFTGRLLKPLLAAVEDAGAQTELFSFDSLTVHPCKGCLEICHTKGKCHQQDDFEKIIVITHIEEFRDAFPTRIDVIKTAEGSTIEVN